MKKISRIEYEKLLISKGLDIEEVKGVLMRLQLLGRLAPYNPQQKIGRYG